MRRVQRTLRPPPLVGRLEARRKLGLGVDLARLRDRRDGSGEVDGLLGRDDVLVLVLAFWRGRGDTAGAKVIHSSREKEGGLRLSRLVVLNEKTRELCLCYDR